MITCEKLSFQYPSTESPVLRDVSLQIPPGEFVLVAGESGAGKSTFLRCLNGLVPHFSGGTLTGILRVAGLDPVACSPRRMSREVGFVFQDPENQFVMDTVEDDIAFTLENAGIPAEQIQEKIEAALIRLNLQAFRQRKIHSLSGGERQRAALASAIVCSPRLLVLDEPTSQLDPQCAYEILETILQLKRQLGLTVLLSEHRLERVLEMADRLIYFDAPTRSVQVGLPEQVLPSMRLQPPLVSIGLKLGWQPIPRSIEQARPFAARSRASWQNGRSGSAALPAERSEQNHRPPVLEIEQLYVAVGTNPVLKGVNLSLKGGEILALMGENGAGKTTLLRTVTGLQRRSRGSIRLEQTEIGDRPAAEICRRIGYLPQDPNALLFADTVAAELQHTLRNHRLPADPVWIESLLARLGLLAEAQRYPRDLSVGQRQRVALAAILVTQPAVLLLDEPTRGMDQRVKMELLDLLRAWRDEGKAVLLVSHDVELVAAAADRVARLEDGRIVQSGPPGQVLPLLGKFAPQTAQLFPGTGWLTETDLLRCGML